MFNHSIAGVVWPGILRQLSFGKKINQPITEVVWPTSLQQLEFGEEFKQAIAGVVWPASLKTVTRQGVSLLRTFSRNAFGGLATFRRTFGKSAGLIRDFFNRRLCVTV